MKVSFNLFITALAISIIGCKNKADEATTTEAKEVVKAAQTSENYKANTETSSIAWKGFKPAGSHDGTIKLLDGSLELLDSKITGGNFTIDMSSITVLDIPADDEGNAKLLGHLTTGDFFDVEKYPKATFKITGVQDLEGKTMLSGNLTLKEATNNVSFPVVINHTGDAVTLTSETFTIDRTKWNIKYSSKSFFSDLGDKFINDEIELKVNVVATK